MKSIDQIQRESRAAANKATLVGLGIGIVVTEFFESQKRKSAEEQIEAPGAYWFLGFPFLFCIAFLTVMPMSAFGIFSFVSLMVYYCMRLMDIITGKHPVINFIYYVWLFPFGLVGLLSGLGGVIQ